MAFHKIERRRDLELPTFIDVIFLLLIFFLLTYSPVPPVVGQASLELNLPIAEGTSQVNPNEKLETLMIEIIPVNKEQLELGFNVSVLLPFEDYGMDRGVDLSYQQAQVFASRYQRQSLLPGDYTDLRDSEFLRLPAVELIDDHLGRFVSRRFRVAKATNRIEIRADKDVTFRIINFVIEKCSSYGDLVPSLIFRTMFEKE